MGSEPEETNAAEQHVDIVVAPDRGLLLEYRKAWASAYMKQSRSDWAVYELFTSKDLRAECPPLTQVELCHNLHYLQMACEKIAKAYRLRDTSTAIENSLTSHVAFSKFIIGFLKAPDVRARYRNKSAELRQITRIAHLLAKEIEILAPALGREIAPHNSEYPWAANRHVITPCEYSFPNVNMLREPQGRNFLKIIKIAIIDFDKIKLA